MGCIGQRMIHQSSTNISICVLDAGLTNEQRRADTETNAAAKVAIAAFKQGGPDG